MPRSGRPSPTPARAALVLEHADPLYDFALTVTWDPDAASEAIGQAITKLPPEAASAAAAYSAVRETSLALARRETEVDIRAELPPPEPLAGTLEAIALGVADALDPSDRAVLDLAVRRGIEGPDLATALGIPDHEVRDTVDRARNRTDRLLRNYILARVGVDACPRLADALENPPNHLAALSEVVDAHCDECTICDDRRRAFAPPTALLADLPERPAPDTLRQRLQELAAGDGSLPEPPTSRRLSRFAAVAGVAVLALAAIVVGARLFDGADGVATPEAPTGLLAASVETVDFGEEATVRSVTVSNPGDATVDLEARVDIAWLTVTPETVTLERGGTAELTVTLDRAAAPEGTSITTIRFVSEGGIVTVDVTAHVARPPVISRAEAIPTEVSVAPCEGGVTTANVTASIVEESGFQSVIVRWEGLPGSDDETEGEIEMSGTGERFEATLGPFTEAGTATWWIRATDVGGNVGESDPFELTVVPECEPAGDDETG